MHEVLGEKFYDVISVTKYKVDALVKKDPELRQGVDACQNRYVAEKPRLKSQKAEPKE